MHPQHTAQQLPLPWPAHDGKYCRGCGTLKASQDFIRDRTKRDGLSTRCAACRQASQRVWYRTHKDQRQALARSHYATAKAAGPPEGTKVCLGCRIAKPYAAFGLSSTNKDRRASRCRVCSAAVVAQWRAAHPERSKQIALVYRVSHRAALIGRCREWRDRKVAHVATYNRTYKQAHALEIAQATRRYRQAHAHGVRLQQKAYRLLHRKERALHQRARQHRKRANGGGYTPAAITLLLEVQQGCCAYCHTALGLRFNIDHMTPLSRGGSNALPNLCLACPPCDRAKWTMDAGHFLARLIKSARS